MANIKKKGSSWVAQINRRGVRKSGSFPTKARAVAWATQLESEILADQYCDIPNKTFSDLLGRYSVEVSEFKISRIREKNRIKFLQRDPLAQVPLPDLKPKHFAAWRDRRLREVSAATILRDWNLLTHAINVSIKEWGWLKESPIKNVRRPAEPLPRSRRISQDEIDRLCFALGYDQVPETAMSRIAAAMLFAIESAMRVGEICSLTWDQVDLKRRYVHIPKTKNGFPRDVPLSRVAMKILEELPRSSASAFNLRTAQVDALFRKAKNRAMIDDLHFHDTRREALTRLAKKFDVMALAKISGHRDLSILQEVYYAPTVEDLASKMD